MKTTNVVDIQKIAETSGKTAQEVEAIIGQALNALSPETKIFSAKESGKIHDLKVTRTGVGILSTDFGKFWQYSFHIADSWQEYVVIWKGEVDDNLNPSLVGQTLVLRIDSGCETGQVMGDRTCECREQLHLAMEAIASEQNGMIVHIPKQDGRGMGTPFKLGTLFLQERLGLNTVQSATILGKGERFDIRTYAGVIGILQYFSITNAVKICLATNNPAKTFVFMENGYEIMGLKAVVAPVTEETRHHLKAKQEFLGHIDLVREGNS